MKKNTLELALELKKLVIEIERKHDEIQKESQRIDLIREDVLHHLENNTFSTRQGYKCAKALKIVARERRIIKEELALIQCLCSKASPLKKEILKAAKKVEDSHRENERRRNSGEELYNPRVVKGMNSDDIVNQITEVLNLEENI